MKNHFMLQGIINVEDNQQRAKARWRTFTQVAHYGNGAMWGEGVYENEYIKEGGVWKISKMKFWPTYYTSFDKGWAKEALPSMAELFMREHPDFPPDLPASDKYDVWPGHHVPPFHYPNPVTRSFWQRASD